MTDPLLTHLADQLAPGAVEPTTDAELERLLEVATAELARYGVARTSLSDIARKAGVSRPTAYRRLGNKELMLQRILVREAVTFFDDLRRATESIEDPVDRAVEAFVVGQRNARRNPLVTQLLAEEPEALVPHLTTSGDPWLSMITEILAQFVDPDGRLGRRRARRAAELVVRLSTSFLLTPSGVLAGGSEKSLRAFADSVVRAAVEAA